MLFWDNGKRDALEVSLFCCKNVVSFFFPFLTVKSYIQEEKIVKLISKQCPMCGETVYMRLEDNAYERWTHYVLYKGLIQNVFPEMDAFQREFIKSGYCPKCQEALFENEWKNKESFIFQNELNRERIDVFMEETRELDPESSILSKAAEKLSAAEKLVYLYEMELDELELLADGTVQKK